MRTTKFGLVLLFVVGLVAGYMWPKDEKATKKAAAERSWAEADKTYRAGGGVTLPWTFEPETILQEDDRELRVAWLHNTFVQLRQRAEAEKDGKEVIESWVFNAHINARTLERRMAAAILAELETLNEPFVVGRAADHNARSLRKAAERARNLQRKVDDAVIHRANKFSPIGQDVWARMAQWQKFDYVARSGLAAKTWNLVADGALKEEVQEIVTAATAAPGWSVALMVAVKVTELRAQELWRLEKALQDAIQNN